MEQKLEPKMQKEIPQQPLTAESYVDELVEIAAQKMPRTLVIEFLKSWRHRAQKGIKKLPFEKMMKPYKLSQAEWYCLGVVAYQNLVGRRLGTGREDLIDRLLQTGICTPSQLKNIFGPQSTLFAQHILMEEGGRLVVNRKFYDALFGINTQADKNTKKEVVPQVTVRFPLNLPDQIKKIVIGQDEAVDQLCNAVYEHYLRCQNGQTAGKNNVLLLGPTGTGKTFLCQTLARLLKVPFADVNASQFTESGYVGNDVGDILRQLHRQVPNLVRNTFPFSIVYLDEIDKLRMRPQANGRDIKGGVQGELLKLLENSQYVSAAKHFETGRTYNIGNVLFILGGAFVGLDEIIGRRLNKRGIGFAASENTQSVSATLKQVSTEDLVSYGFLPELLGRLTGRIVLNELTEDDYLRILTEGKSSVISQYKAIYKQAGIRLITPRKVLREMAHEATLYPTGARGLTQVVSNWLSHKLLKTKRARKKQYTLSCEP